jgi:tRNA (guanine37-N1)-methyltransferase
VITLFPEIFSETLQASILGRAQDSGAVQIKVHNLRDWAQGVHRQVDDSPYGGGPGMVLKPEPLAAAIRATRSEAATVIALSPSGRRLDRDLVLDLSGREHLVLLCGRYEGFDQRILDAFVDAEISIGDYVLTGGEFPALVLIDAVVRRLPGVLGNEDAAGDDSFEAGLLEAPAYTRPANFEGTEVPEVLLSGDHGRVRRWRLERSLDRTLRRRPDLLEARKLPAEWEELLAALANSATKE